MFFATSVLVLLLLIIPQLISVGNAKFQLDEKLLAKLDEEIQHARTMWHLARINNVRSFRKKILTLWEGKKYAERKDFQNSWVAFGMYVYKRFYGLEKLPWTSILDGAEIRESRRFNALVLRMVVLRELYHFHRGGRNGSPGTRLGRGFFRDFRDSFAVYRRRDERIFRLPTDRGIAEFLEERRQRRAKLAKGQKLPSVRDEYEKLLRTAITVEQPSWESFVKQLGKYSDDLFGSILTGLTGFFTGAATGAAGGEDDDEGLTYGEWIKPNKEVVELDSYGQMINGTLKQLTAGAYSLAEFLTATGANSKNDDDDDDEDDSAREDELPEKKTQGNSEKPRDKSNNNAGKKTVRIAAGTKGDTHSRHPSISSQHHGHRRSSAAKSSSAGEGHQEAKKGEKLWRKKEKSRGSRGMDRSSTQRGKSSESSLGENSAAENVGEKVKKKTGDCMTM